MDWLDYREKLGIGFNDEDKVQLFYTKLFNVLNMVISSSKNRITFDEYFVFCNDTGSRLNDALFDEYRGQERLRDCIAIISQHKTVFEDFIAYYIWFVNTIGTDDYRNWNKINYLNLLKRCLDESHILYDIFEDEGKYFVFPKGAQELDGALVSQPLEWLKDYPGARNTYVIALKQYSDGIYIRDVADNLRKALETFLQEFFGNTKNLETNKNEICRYLGEQGVDSGVSGLFQTLINSYKNVNDRIAKHNDAVDEKLLEFLLYQTGILIRMVITVKLSEACED